MIFAKGIASGFPFAGLATRENMFEGLATGTMGGTYGDSFVCTALSTPLIATGIGNVTVQMDQH